MFVFLLSDDPIHFRIALTNPNNHQQPTNQPPEQHQLPNKLPVTMGSAQSSVIKRREVAELAPTSSSDVGSHDEDNTSNNWVNLSASDEDSDEEDEDSDVDVDERLCILRESRKLKMLADFFLHPEKPVQSDATACARCYFDRPSAPQHESMEEADEAARILKDAKALKKLAVDYQHPERPVETSDATACARCYFDRPSAPQPESMEEANERAAILKELHLLKKAAYDYLHLEVPVSTTDPTIFGRNYFCRASAPEQETEEMQLILEDAKALRKLARDYRHSEMPVVTSDPTIFGRNYFTHPSAPEQESLEEEEERTRILKEASTMKKLASDYRHPELPVATTDPTIFGRNYFTRPSAPNNAKDEERQRVLEDAKALRKLALDYLHPELPVVASDPTVFGRNYFSRPSAVPQTTLEDEEEKDHVLEECHRLEQLAVDYHHPEVKVTTDPHYFAAEEDDEEDYYHHHAHFDMDDDIHLHHVEFDKDTAHHDDITEMRTATPGVGRHDAAVDFKFSQSPGCVMTFTDPTDVSSIMAPTLSR